MPLSNTSQPAKPLDCGLTLLEVLVALLITGIFMASILPLFVDQWRGADSLSNYLEAQYAVLTAGHTISAEIRSAKTIEWVQSSQTLNILPLPSDANSSPTQDSYFIADLDNDGIKDLYWKHLGSKEPLASHFSGWKCTEVEPGLWNISLEASIEGQNVWWRSSIKQRLYFQLKENSDQPDM